MTPYNEGYTAYGEGEFRHANPYPTGSVANLDWDRGWCDAYDDEDDEDVKD